MPPELSLPEPPPLPPPSPELLVGGHLVGARCRGCFSGFFELAMIFRPGSLQLLPLTGIELGNRRATATALERPHVEHDRPAILDVDLRTVGRHVADAVRDGVEELARPASGGGGPGVSWWAGSSGRSVRSCERRPAWRPCRRPPRPGRGRARSRCRSAPGRAPWSAARDLDLLREGARPRRRRSCRGRSGRLRGARPTATVPARAVRARRGRRRRTDSRAAPCTSAASPCRRSRECAASCELAVARHRGERERHQRLRQRSG